MDIKRGASQWKVYHCVINMNQTWMLSGRPSIPLGVSPRYELLRDAWSRNVNED